ncbi:hypothetical protein Taro_008280, partial [Colocasia esculenta]|nr:hypothetical protein [Colocasia esculenta]
MRRPGRPRSQGPSRQSALSRSDSDSSHRRVLNPVATLPLSLSERDIIPPV